MRRLLSLVLLLAFGLPVAAPVLGMDADAQSSLPMCCRRNGAHHCMGKDPMATLAQATAGARVGTVRAKCPYTPAAAASLHHPVLARQADSPSLPGSSSRPARLRQIEAWARSAAAGARHKRGPPSVRLS